MFYLIAISKGWGLIIRTFFKSHLQNEIHDLKKKNLRILLYLFNKFKAKNAPVEVMESLNWEQVKTLIGRFYIQNYQAGKVFTFKHFSAI